jgi:hypothetical protein
VDAEGGLLERQDVAASAGELVGRVAAGGAGAVFVVGEAGLGKTSLIDRACGLAAAAGLQVGLGRGHPMETGLPFGLLAQALEGAGGRGLLGEHDPEPASAGDRAARFYRVLRWLHGRLPQQRPARDHLRLPFPRSYTWQNKRSGLVAAPGRSQLLTSTASIRRPSGARGSGSPGHRPAQPRDIDPPVIHRVIQGAVAAPVLRRQRQAHQGLHRPLGAQQRVGDLEQRITTGGAAAIQITAERRQPLPRPLHLRPWLDPGRKPRHTERHGHRLVYGIFAGTRR